MREDGFCVERIRGMRKNAAVFIWCLLFAFVCWNVAADEARAAVKENGTLVCSAGQGDQYSRYTLVYKGDVIQKQTLETKANWESIGFRTREDFLDAFKKRKELYGGFKGVTYTFALEGPLYTEKIIIDFAAADYSKLVSKPQFGFVPGSKYPSLKAEKKTLEEIGYTCVYK